MGSESRSDQTSYVIISKHLDLQILIKATDSTNMASND